MDITAGLEQVAQAICFLVNFYGKLTWLFSNFFLSNEDPFQLKTWNKTINFLLLYLLTRWTIKKLKLRSKIY